MYKGSNKKKKVHTDANTGSHVTVECVQMDGGEDGLMHLSWLPLQLKS